VTYTAHLDNALQSEKLPTDEWLDMMMVRTLLEDSNFFVGEAPTSPEDYIKKFNLQTGISIAAMSSKRRKNTKFESNNGPQGKQHIHFPILSMHHQVAA
jgi:hypothetical protein